MSLVKEGWLKITWSLLLLLCFLVSLFVQQIEFSYTHGWYVENKQNNQVGEILHPMKKIYPLIQSFIFIILTTNNFIF